jgi:hypothetical protein
VTTLLQAPLTVAAAAACELCQLLSAGGPAPKRTALAVLTRVANAVESCPNFTPAEMCYFRNRLASCRRLLREGEWGAARYEMSELSKKLTRAGG